MRDNPIITGVLRMRKTIRIPILQMRTEVQGILKANSKSQSPILSQVLLFNTNVPTILSPYHSISSKELQGNRNPVFLRVLWNSVLPVFLKVIINERSG